jgi:Holliday junction resolvase RusA-like endonuclease
MDGMSPATFTVPVESVEQLRFHVDGVPVPQGSKTGFVVGKRAVLVDANKALKPWRATVRDAAETALAGRSGFTDAVFVLLDFYMPRGKTVRRLRPSTKPDIDKLIRAVFDALTDSGVLADDGLVVSVHAQQFYADDKPGVDVKVGVLA